MRKKASPFSLYGTEELRPQPSIYQDPVTGDKQNIEAHVPVAKGRFANEVDHLLSDFRSRAKNNKVSSHSRLESASSISSASSFRLPRVRLQEEQEEEESRLMKRIKKVGNKIKELRYERELQERADEHLYLDRPWIEWQRQNQHQMNMMMGLIESMKHNKCNCQNYPSQQPQPVYLPFPNNHLSPQPPQPQVQTQPKRTAFNKRARRRWRVACIAVYFTLLLPKFSHAFSIKRHQLRNQLSKGNSLSKVTSTFLQEIECLDFVSIFRKTRQDRNSRLRRGESRQFLEEQTLNVVITEQYSGLKEFQLDINQSQYFALSVLKTLKEQIEEGSFKQTIGMFANNYLPFSFPLDKLLIPQETYRLQLHPEKGYNCMESQGCKGLIMACLFVKLLIFGLLLPVKEDERWKDNVVRKRGMKRRDRLEVEGISTQMYVVGIIFYDACMDLLFNKLGHIQGNIETLPLSKQPLSADMLFLHLKDSLIPLLNIRMERLDLINEEQVFLDLNQLDPLQLFDRIPIFLFQLIKNMEQFQVLVSQMRRIARHRELIKNTIEDLVEFTYEQAKKARKQAYTDMRVEVLSSNLHLASKAKAKYTWEVNPRNRQDKDKIKEYMQLMKRQRKGEGEEELEGQSSEYSGSSSYESSYSSSGRSGSYSTNSVSKSETSGSGSSYSEDPSSNSGTSKHNFKKKKR